MATYLIQKQICTLLDFLLFNEAKSIPSFTLHNIEFSPWNQDERQTRLWLAERTVDADSYMSAWKVFHTSLRQIVSRTSFVGQAYHTDLGQPYLIKKADSDVAIYRYTRERRPVPLHFNAETLQSLAILLDDARVPDAFYWYWNDAVNALGYSAKLVLMFAAVEVLFEKASKKKVDYYADIERVFGPKDKITLFGKDKDKGRSGVRQRLVHGDYFSEKDTQNYVELIHKTIVRYFNDNVLHDHRLSEDIVNPQRHFYGNLDEWRGYIQSVGDAPLLLKPVQEEFKSTDMLPKNYQIVPLEEEPPDY
jgi:hypothetical protein